MPVSRFEHLRLKSGFEAVKSSGRRESSGFFTMLYLLREAGEKREIGIICSRKFDVRAVRRNRARRLIREAMRLIGPASVVPSTLVVIPRRAILKAGMPAVRKALLHALNHAGLLLPENGEVSLPEPSSVSSSATGN